MPITNRTAILHWVIYAFVLFLAAFIPLIAGPDEPSIDQASVSMTMTFAVMGLGTAFNALVNRRDPATGLTPPILKSVGIGFITVTLLFLATQLPTLQKGLLTTTLTPLEWLISAGLAALLPLVVELSKLVRRRRAPAQVLVGPEHVVAQSRALSENAA